MGLMVIYLTLAGVLLWVLYDNTRMTRANRAGLEAVDHFWKQVRAAKARSCLKVKTEVYERDHGYSILVWDADPAFPDQVDGVLVPYFVATGDTVRQCKEQVGRYFQQLAVEHNGVLTVQFVGEHIVDPAQ